MDGNTSGIQKMETRNKKETYPGLYCFNELKDMRGLWDTGGEI